MAHAEEPEDRTARGERWDRGEGLTADQAVRPGSLLVSSAELVEPSFRRTVVYVIEHNDAGSLGVVLNRPSDTAVRNVLPQWSELAARPKSLFVGGPVKRDAALCLATIRIGADITDVPGLRRVDGRVAMVDLDSDPEQLAPYIVGVRVFAGYSGWTLGQLEGELERDDWIVLSALPTDLIGPPRVDLWANVLRRQPLPLALLATHPIEVERN
ncbi:YqgE/AlgH family protein [Aldersonia sp. NBC_00410]|uniref:YqgE/AlgH family protein n=1 Tax=Aldersonia sp. NBC_00410 TaxID=2975954 RepID=UPI00224F0A02|nr:YqgE/AlgH family protein [Aldersonia sp. NBC_00410]MCX5044988.1 YqgE/AlgH family protein [Aldersonia sp. NBC_00410]